MAYNFFPKTPSEIQSKLNTWPKKKVDELMHLLAWLLDKYPKHETPINIDPTKQGLINVTRQLEGDIKLDALKRYADISSFNLKFGEGSAGNRGANNRGNAFEGIFQKGLEDWWAGIQIPDAKMIAALEDLKTVYNLTKYKKITVKAEGALNKKRPLVYTPDVIISAPGGKANNDIGALVTDLTLMGDGKVVAYLSLKLGNTATFFNVGVKTVLTTDEIKSGKITNVNGLKLLGMFNIKPPVFCDVFNGKLAKGYSEDVWPNMTGQQKDNLKKLLASGVGQGYHVIHKLAAGIKSIKIDPHYMELASTPTSCTLYYGGKGGLGKRIDMEIITKKYVLKLNIRDTQGQGGYPTRLMGDFTYV
jgi:hypothetical protein